LSGGGYGAASGARGGVSFLGVLWRRAPIILAVVLLSAGAAAAFAFAGGDRYESTAKLLFRQTIGPEQNAQGLQPGAPDADNLAQDNVARVDSRRVAAATARELSRLGVSMSADEVDDDVLVTGRNDSEVVDLTATADSASRAALVANTYAVAAVRLAEADQRAITLRNLRSVNRQLRELPRRQRAGADGTRLRADRQRLRTLADAGTGSPEIIQRGHVPSSSSGSPLETILLGALFGLILGVGLALLREQVDRRLHHAEEVSAAFDAPVLTTVPRNRGLKRHAPLAELPAGVAESFRMLQMNLRFGQRPPVRSVLITSARSREGKTTVAWNLACAAAQAGLTVAFVEADMRRPSIAGRYGLQPEPGLSEALREQVPVVEALQSVPVAADPAGNGRAGKLDVLVAGTPPPDPWALTQTPAIDRILAALKQNYDLVVLDTPPIPHVADAISLLRKVDGVIATASVNSTRGPEAGHLKERLQALGANVLGVVANGGSTEGGYTYAPTPAGYTNGQPRTPAAADPSAGGADSR
jgi:polysaccharide biosynthesis transport protein